MDIETKKNHFNFSQDVFWVALSQIIISLFGIITLPALTKTYSASLYGVWSQISITIGLLAPILTLHLGTATVRYLAGETDIKKISQSFSNMLTPILILIFIVISISFVMPVSLSNILFNSKEYVNYVYLTFMWAGSTALYLFLISYLRSQGEIKKLSIINVLSTLLKATSLVILALLNYSLITIIISQIIIDFIFIMILYSLIIKKIGFSFPNLLNLKKFLSLSVPDIPSGIIMWILNSLDRFFIINYLSLSQAAVYSASYNIGNLLTLFFSPISFVLFPLLSKLWVNGKIKDISLYLEYSLKIFLLLSIPAATGLYLLANPLLTTLTTSEYAVGGTLTFFIALGTIFLGVYQINIYIIYLEKKTKWIPLITLISALVNIVLNIFLIQMVGLIGAAIATVVSYMILALIVIIWVQRSLSYNFDLKFLFKIMCATFIMAICLKFINITGPIEIIADIIIGALIYVFCLLIFKTLSKTEKRLISEILGHFLPI